jgi:methoxymalonate biosynthesis acyl carrier protein
MFGAYCMATSYDNMAGQALSSAEIVSSVRAFVTRTLSHKVLDSENIFQMGLVSSLFGLQLITFLEEAFGIHVTDEDLDLDNFMSIENITRFVVRKKQRP